jgi:hypothetical protein
MANDRSDKQKRPAGQAASADQSNVRPRDIVIEMGPPPTFNVTCYGFHLWAGDFLAAERLYAPTARNGSFVPQFLCCQSIELSLKGFLSLSLFHLQRSGVPEATPLDLPSR